MRNQLTVAFAVLSLQPFLYGQVTAPAAISSRPSVRLFSPDGAIHYALTLSEVYERGGAVPGGSENLYTASGNLSYSTPSTKRPFSMLYTGGWRGSTNSAQPSAPFHTLGITQGFSIGKWAASVSNQFSYLPETPSVGLSGIPGLGDIGLQIAQPPTGQSPDLLSNYGSLINETLTGSVSRQINYDTYLTGTADWGEMYFIKGTGLNTNQVMGTLGATRRLSARSNMGANYAYSRFSYSNEDFSFTTNGLNVVGQHQWTRSLNTNISIGPQWIGSSTAAVPSRTALAVTAAATYARRFSSANLSYSHGSTGGSGVVPGGFSNSIQASAQQTFQRSWAASVTGAYTSISGLGSGNGSAKGLSNYGSGNSKYISVQGTRSLGRSFSAYLSYTAQFQSFDQTLATKNALSGLAHVVGAGISFSPQSKHLGQL